MTAFGPQLIGATEKTLKAVLHHLLADAALTEPQWVTLRLAAQNATAADLAVLVGERAHFANAATIVADLTHRGLIADETHTPAGHELLTELQSRVAIATAPIWADLDPDDVAATERVLERVNRRAGQVLQALSASVA